jgi:hypothetical protein
MHPDESQAGIVGHARRLLEGTDALLFSVTFSGAGADITLFAPYTSGEEKSGLAGLGSLPDKATIDLSAMPGETAALVAFRAFDPGIVYTHFGKVWFSDIAQKVNYISILKKWKDKGGFDLEGGIINNLGRGALAALVGIGYEGEKPYLRTIASFGVAPGKEPDLSANIGKLYSYSFFDTGPSPLELDGVQISYMGTFREKSLDWDGTSYIGSVKPNEGFAFKDKGLFLFWDLSTMEQLIDLSAISSMTGARALFDRDFLVKSPAFIAAQKDMPKDAYDLYLYVDGNNAMSLIEGYLVNISANYKYFLYQDSEKRLVPLVELTRRSFVSCYGGVNFGGDAIQGGFKIRVKDLD